MRIRNCRPTSGCSCPATAGRSPRGSLLASITAAWRAGQRGARQLNRDPLGRSESRACICGLGTYCFCSPSAGLVPAPTSRTKSLRSLPITAAPLLETNPTIYVVHRPGGSRSRASLGAKPISLSSAARRQSPQPSSSSSLSKSSATPGRAAELRSTFVASRIHRRWLSSGLHRAGPALCRGGARLRGNQGQLTSRLPVRSSTQAAVLGALSTIATSASGSRDLSTSPRAA
jgi:hypothetical protein